MRPNLRIPLILFCTAINHFASSHSSVQFGCEPYMDDIQAALREFSHSTLTGRTVLNPEGRQEVVDWTGLLETLYPGLSGNDYLEEAWTTLPALLNYAYYFDQNWYASINDALVAGARVEDALLPPNVQTLDSTTLWICDTTDFVKVNPLSSDPQWYDPDSREVFFITPEPEICPQGLKSRIALHPGRPGGPPKYYVIILCPPAVTQTPGLPKMYRDLGGGQLTDTRPDTVVSQGHPFDPNTPLTPEMTMNLQFWAGMHIDQLRERTLSVILGRYVLLIQAQKYATRLFNRAGGPITIMDGFKSFDRASTMGAFGGLVNVDSYSLLITGAAVYMNEVAPNHGWFGVTFRRWNRQGYWYDNTERWPDRMNDNANWYGSDWIR